MNASGIRPRSSLSDARSARKNGTVTRPVGTSHSSFSGRQGVSSSRCTSVSRLRVCTTSSAESASSAKGCAITDSRISIRVTARVTTRVSRWRTSSEKRTWFAQPASASRDIASAVTRGGIALLSTHTASQLSKTSPRDTNALRAPLEHFVQAARLVLIAVDRVLDLLGRVAEEDVGLTLHRADARHLEHQPLQRDRAGLRLRRQQLAGALRQIEEDRARLDREVAVR